MSNKKKSADILEFYKSELYGPVWLTSYSALLMFQSNLAYSLLFGRGSPLLLFLDTVIGKLVLGTFLGLASWSINQASSRVLSSLPMLRLPLSDKDRIREILRYTGHFNTASFYFGLECFLLIIVAVLQMIELLEIPTIFTNTFVQLIVILLLLAPFVPWFFVFDAGEYETSRMTAMRLHNIKDDFGGLFFWIYAWSGITFIGLTILMLIVLFFLKTTGYS